MGANTNSGMTAAELEAHRRLLSKWLGVLLICRLAAAVISAAAAIPGTDHFTAWLSHIASIGVITAWFQLSPANVRYRKAAIFRCVALVGVLLGRELLPLLLSLFSLLADYQDHFAHAEIVGSSDPQLSGRWRTLFTWRVVLPVFFGLAATAGALVAIAAEVAVQDAISAVLLCAAVAGLVPEVIYLLYLKRTIALCGEEKRGENP